MQFISSSARQTFSFAKKLAKQLQGGETIGLIGQLGAGKTIFTKGLASGLGIKKNITSPTFVLMRVYPVKSFSKGRRNFAESKIISRGKSLAKILVHIDAYRLKSTHDLTAIGAKEYFNRSDAITVIEWADKIKKILPKKARLVTIKLKGGNKRIINY